MFRTLLLATLMLATLALALDISWFRPLKPGDYNVGFSACAFGDYVAVVGGTDGRGYVALLDKSSGSLVKEWRGEERSGYFFSCAASGGVLYVAGEPGLYAFDRDLNVLYSVSPEDVVYNAITAANGYVYAAGYYDYDKLYVEKRASDLSLVANATYIEEGWYLAEAYGVAVDPSTGRVWVAGRYDDGDYERPLILIFDSDLRLVRKVALPEMRGFFSNVCFMGGYAFVSGSRNVFKFDKSDNLVDKAVGGGQLACANGKLFVFWYAELMDGYRLGYTVLDTSLRELKTVALAKNDYEAVFYAPGRPDTDGQRVYAVAVVEGSRETFAWVYAVPADVSIIEQVPVLRITSWLKLIAIVGILALAVVGWIWGRLKRGRGAGTAQPS